jgi:hypothetical protein
MLPRAIRNLSLLSSAAAEDALPAGMRFGLRLLLLLPPQLLNAMQLVLSKMLEEEPRLPLMLLQPLPPPLLLLLVRLMMSRFSSDGRGRLVVMLPLECEKKLEALLSLFCADDEAWASRQKLSCRKASSDRSAG